MDHDDVKYGYVHDFDDETSTTRRFRFKDHKKRRPEGEDLDGNGDRRHRRKRRSTRRDESERLHSDAEYHTKSPPPSKSADTTSASPQSRRHSSPLHHMDSDTAFRESLFDAMADEEGADYWTSVYGQPIHNYPNTYVSKETGKLEQMNDDEYTEYVRTKMWEKTHQHVLEERARREAAAKKAKEARAQTMHDGDRMESERDAFRRRMEDSLRRGEERRAEKGWKEAWQRYLELWAKLLDRKERSDEESKHDQLIPWPVLSGKSKDIDAQHIHAFFDHSPKDQLAGRSLKDLLKKERVRWHPDKMQQRLGGKLDTDTLRSITAVFQLIDDMRTKTAE